MCGRMLRVIFVISNFLFGTNYWKKEISSLNERYSPCIKLGHSTEFMEFPKKFDKWIWRSSRTAILLIVMLLSCEVGAVAVECEDCFNHRPTASCMLLFQATPENCQDPRYEGIALIGAASAFLLNLHTILEICYTVGNATVYTYRCSWS